MSREDADELILKLYSMSSAELKKLWAKLFERYIKEALLTSK